MKTPLAIGLTVLMLILTAAKTGGANAGSVETFLIPISVAANSSDNSCWVADTGHSEIVHLSQDSQELWRSGQFLLNFPVSVSVNPTDGSCWAADIGLSAVLHLDQDGEPLWVGGYTDFANPLSVSVNSSDGSCWVADMGKSQVVRLAGQDGKVLWRGGAFLAPVALSVNPTDGSCWVADWGPSNHTGGSVYSTVVHLAASGEELWRAKNTDCDEISSVSVNPTDGSCWVADWGIPYLHEGGYWYESRIVHLSSDGSELWRGDGFNAPYSVSFNPHDGSCWVADTYNNRVVRLKITVDFADVASTYWAFNQIETCFHQGIVRGFPGGLYQPATAVTRDQMAVYISRAVAGGEGNIPAGPAVPSFSDVATDHWAFNYIEYAKSQNIVQGYPDSTYQPSNPVTRDQMAVYISRARVPADDRPNLSNFLAPSNPSFPDVPTSFWAYKYIEYCRAWNIVQGYSDGYRPNEITTRDQMAVYIQRAFDLPIY